MHIAASRLDYRFADIVESLIQKDASLDVRDLSGLTPFEVASASGSKGTARLLPREDTKQTTEEEWCNRNGVKDKASRNTHSAQYFGHLLTISYLRLRTRSLSFR